jgi:hypothetical protein
MAGRGTGVLTSISINGGAPLITAPYVEGFTFTPEKESYRSAAMVEVRRGSGVARVAGTIWSYADYPAALALMVARTPFTTILNYRSGRTLTLTGCKLAVTPVLMAVQGIQTVMIGPAAAVDNNLDVGTGWTDLGQPLDDGLELTFERNTHTAGRLPYYSWMRARARMLFPDTLPSVITAATIAKIDPVKLAFKFGADIWLVISSAYLTENDDADQDGDRPLVTEVIVEGADETPGSIFYFWDGSAGAVANPGNLRFGWELQITGAYFGAMSDIASFSA